MKEYIYLDVTTYARDILTKTSIPVFYRDGNEYVRIESTDDPIFNLNSAIFYTRIEK